MAGKRSSRGAAANARAARNAATVSSATGRTSRAAPIVSMVSSTVSSALPTPLSSAYPSTYASEAENDLNEQIENLAIGTLTLDSTSPDQPTRPKRKFPRIPQPPFRFLDLPSELRIKVYEHHFANTGDVLDLAPDNYKRFHQKLSILRVCRTIYIEASYTFYSTHAVRIFPTHPGRFFKTKKPLLARLKPGQRACLSTLQLRLGPGWSKPPPGWVVNSALGLDQCVNVTKLSVYVECDPGNDTFKGFRQPGGFYEAFSKLLLLRILNEMPWVQRVEFDAWPSVKKSGGLMTGLIDLVTSRSLKITWGPDRGWTDAEEVEPPPIPHNYAPIDSLMNNTGNILGLA
ncbi:hypothetical protein GGS20DRAFT_146265 [Poronia punctata]|nr:hypothetical protein GGS20DRAFT_146265 [Poronia punctata]